MINHTYRFFPMNAVHLEENKLYLAEHNKMYGVDIQ